MSKPQLKDQVLYDKIKKEINTKYKPSAYRSGLLVKKYKEEYLKKHKSSDAYTGNRSNSNLKRWFDEKWMNQKGKVGYQKKGDVYRPTIKINNNTPKTFNELTQNQINKAMEEKKRKGRVKKF
jgi:hypothetical protein